MWLQYAEPHPTPLPNVDIGVGGNLDHSLNPRARLLACVCAPEKGGSQKQASPTTLIATHRKAVRFVVELWHFYVPAAVERLSI